MTSQPILQEQQALSRSIGEKVDEPTPAGSISSNDVPDYVPVVVIGAGQAGLSVGYHLKRLGVRFVILDANDRIGDQWRRRWDSLRLFTPAKFDGLDGMRFPSPRDSFPTKDEMADYLESYARRFSLPIRMRAPVRSLSRLGDRFLVETDGRSYLAQQVIVAAAGYQRPRVLAFAGDLEATVLQIHSADYRRPSQLNDGAVLIVGAGNSGAEIAVELARDREVWLSGRDVGYVPFKIAGFIGRKVLVRLVLRGLFHRVLTVRTPMGRRLRPRFLSQGMPLIRTRPGELAKAGVKRVARITGVRKGRPATADGEILDVANVIWCTGFDAGLPWVKLPILDQDGHVRHHQGRAIDVPGLFFVGLHFQFAVSSTLIHGVGRDAKAVALSASQALSRS